MEWKLAEAKNKFSEVMDKALMEGPQKITRRKNSVIVLDEREFVKLTGKKKGFKEHLFQGPSFEGLDLARDQSPMRKINV